MLRSTLPVLAGCLMPALHAQDGGQMYTLYCSACHGADGAGATGGQFPPLAGSPWVAGDAARAVKIVLHGIHDPIEVDGRTFNLEMPPQGGLLSDEQIAAILSYVRSSWGNHGEAVTAELVKTARAATADRKGPWTAGEIAKLHPLPAAPPPIANLLSHIYHGRWQDLPDFSKQTPLNVEEEHKGLLSLKIADVKDGYGIVWEGDLTAPAAGAFTFRLDADDSARVVIDGKTVTEVRGTGPMDGGRAQSGEIELSAGPHRLRVEYVEYAGNEGLELAWKGPGLPRWRNLTDQPLSSIKGPIPIEPTASRAVIYRNFIDGTTPRGIGVGFPGGVNLAYSADHLAPELLWTGEFMDGSRHWVDRGQGFQAPAGQRVIKLAASPALSTPARFRGYKLDPAGNPTFSVQVGQGFLLDAWKPGDSPGARSLVRTLSLKGGTAPLELLLSDKLPLKATGAQDFDLGDQLALHVEAGRPESRDGKVFLKLEPGQTATLTYRWK